MKWSVVAALVAASIMSLTLMSGKAVLNFNHTPNLTAELQDPIFKVSMENGVPSIYLSESIKSPNDYKNLIIYINSHKNTPNMNVYLAGRGGDAFTALNLINTMHSSSTKFHMIVYGDVYSAHALLAVSGDSLTILNENILFLFHVPAVKNSSGEYIKIVDSCRDTTGNDRGISAKHKCEVYSKRLDEEFMRASYKAIAYMTGLELKAYLMGDDIIISGKQIKERQQIKQVNK